MKSVRSSPYAKTISRYCHIFLAVDLVLIIAVVYTWYSLCKGSFCTKIPLKPRSNILVFGDSMTRGFVKRYPEESYYPYSESLMKTLNRLHSKEVYFVVENQGKNGEKVTDKSALSRLNAALRTRQYEWAIILEGTNDLAAYFKYKEFQDLYANQSDFVNKVFNSLKVMCKAALRTHSMVILGTIMARQCEEDALICPSLAANREALNSKLRHFVTETKELLILADFDKELEYKSMSKEKRQKYWQDDVHLTETGYEAMAKLVYKKMLPYLPEMIQQPNASRNNTKQ